MDKKFAIGIISYIPDDNRKQRQTVLVDLIKSCSVIFPGIDIFIIAQNWNDFTVESSSNKITLFKYGKLGISGARNKLRDWFISSEYDYLIMFDDDTILIGNKQNGDRFLSLLKDDSFGIYDWYRRQLCGFAISKSLFKIVEYPKETAENGEIFEDTYLSNICKYHCPDYADLTKSGIKIKENWNIKSTWWDNKKYDLKQMEVNTDNLIRDYIKERS